MKLIEGYMKKQKLHVAYLTTLCLSLLLGASLTAPAQTAKEKSPVVTLAATPAAPSSQTAAAPNGKNASQKISKEGIEVEFNIEPVTGQDKTQLMDSQDALVRFKVIDTATKTPVGGLKPSAWIDQSEAGDMTDPKACREKVAGYLQGSLRSRPDVDLNSFFVLALNREANISVIDPLLGFGGSKLFTLIMLKSPGEDWALSANRELLYVSLPAVNQIAVIDTTTWKVTGYVDAGLRPMRLALQPDEKYLWVANDAEGAQGSGVTLIDTATLKLAASITTGAGHHELAFTDDSRFGFVTNQQSGTLSVVEVAKLAKTQDIKVGASPVSLAFSPLSKSVYVASETDGAITVIDSHTQQVSARMRARAGLKSLRLETKGRYGFITNAKANMVYIFDTSTNRLIHELQVGDAPDQIAFTNAFAYVRSTGTADVSLIRLATIGAGATVAPDITRFPGGQIAPAQGSRSASLADALSPASEPNSMLVANTGDAVIYYYTEGMAAPMGNFQNYRREIKSVRIVDRSLREGAPGIYTTNIKLPTSGNFNVAFQLDAPRITHCFEASAKPNPASLKSARQAAFKIEYLLKDLSIRVGEPLKLRFKLTDAQTGQPKDDLRDVRVLTFLSPGIWQKRDFARSVGGGVYELDVNAPETGFYMVFVGSQKLGIGFRDLPYLALQATDGTATTTNAAAKSTEEKPQP